MVSPRVKLLKKIIGIVILGLLYYVFIKTTGITIPCPVYMGSHGRIKCPGCGVTTMCLDILDGDFAGAFAANPCLFIMFPIAGILILIKLIFDPEWLKYYATTRNVLIKIAVITLIVYGIGRNL